MLPPVTDKQIHDILLRIDVSETIIVTAMEAEFLDSAVYNQHGEWTVEQRAKAAKIAEKYRHKL